jgi:hypothetical protein
LYLINLKIDFKLIKPETKAQIPEKASIIAKFTIQLEVKLLEA